MRTTTEVLDGLDGPDDQKGEAKRLLDLYYDLKIRLNEANVAAMHVHSKDMRMALRRAQVQRRLGECEEKLITLIDEAGGMITLDGGYRVSAEHVRIDGKVMSYFIIRPRLARIGSGVGVVALTVLLTLGTPWRVEAACIDTVPMTCDGNAMSQSVTRSDELQPVIQSVPDTWLRRRAEQWRQQRPALTVRSAPRNRGWF